MPANAHTCLPDYIAQFSIHRLVYLQRMNSPNRTNPIPSQAGHTVCSGIHETRRCGRKSVVLQCHSINMSAASEISQNAVKQQEQSPPSPRCRPWHQHVTACSTGGSSSMSSRNWLTLPAGGSSSPRTPARTSHLVRLHILLVHVTGHNRSLSFPVPDIRPDRPCTYRLYHRTVLFIKKTS